MQMYQLVLWYMQWSKCASVTEMKHNIELRCSKFETAYTRVKSAFQSRPVSMLILQWISETQEGEYELVKLKNGNMKLTHFATIPSWNTSADRNLMSSQIVPPTDRNLSFIFCMSRLQKLCNFMGSLKGRGIAWEKYWLQAICWTKKRGFSYTRWELCHSEFDIAIDHIITTPHSNHMTSSSSKTTPSEVC